MVAVALLPPALLLLLAAKPDASSETVIESLPECALLAGWAPPESRCGGGGIAPTPFDGGFFGCGLWMARKSPLFVSESRGVL